MIRKKIRRFCRKFHYIHPTQRHILLITACLWVSVVTLWTVHVHKDSSFHNSSNDDVFIDGDNLVVYKAKNPFDTVIHQKISEWHHNDKVQLPKLLAEAGSKWKHYPKAELFAWRDGPLHSVRALVDNNKTYHGEMGLPVIIPQNLQSEAKARQSIHQLNVVASELVSLNRRLPDVRNSACCNVKCLDRLPKTSVIIVFHNEAWSTLLRTVHSVINRSPPSLLQEVLLVDDASDHEELLDKLDTYLNTLPVNTRVIRMAERGGLIRARLAGAEQAAGSVLVFLDAHVEATPGWLTPMLAEIATDRTRVLVPVIDEIDAETFAYEQIESDYNRGGLDWKLMHAWIHPVSQPIKGSSPENAIPTPTMIGCAFAIDREFFFASGAYDNQMMIWGGENVEMSLRIWRCGGSLLRAPCSHVGHVYRKNTPHTVPGGLRAKVDTLNINTARFAEVWLDEYKNFYYYMNPAAKNVQHGDLEQRLSLKKELQCHSFKWFLDHVYTDSSLPYNIVYAGQIQHKVSEDCLDAVGSKGEKVAMKVCHGLGGFQTLILTKNNEIKSSTRCIMPNHSKSELVIRNCDFSKAQKWTFKPILEGYGQIVHLEREKCLSYDKQTITKKRKSSSMLHFLSNVVKEVVQDMDSPTLEECNGQNQNQLWSLNLAAKWH